MRGRVPYHAAVPRGTTRRRRTSPTRRDRAVASADLVDAIRRRGCDARDLRDAAHEACHALDLGLSGSWGRERINAALLAKVKRPQQSLDLEVTLYGHAVDLGEFVAAELRARAVESMVCRAFDVKYDVARWAGVSFAETLVRYQLRLPSVEWMLEGIDLHMENPETLRIAQRIQRLR